jgi:hypothetical protein
MGWIASLLSVVMCAMLVGEIVFLFYSRRDEGIPVAHLVCSFVAESMVSVGLLLVMSALLLGAQCNKCLERVKKDKEQEQKAWNNMDFDDTVQLEGYLFGVSDAPVIAGKAGMTQPLIEKDEVNQHYQEKKKYRMSDVGSGGIPAQYEV